jgi:thymidylate kinase
VSITGKQRGKFVVILPVRVWGSTLGLGDIDTGQPETSSATLDKTKDQRLSVPNLPTFSLNSILSSNRIIIIEGITGSGKDTFQKYLKSKLRGRVIHDYTEGEMLWSWKHQLIKDIFKMQIRLMRNFLSYVAAALENDHKAVFLLNRFHLSTYAMYTTSITRQMWLERQYNMVIKALRALPTHVFLLQLMEEEMEIRASHPERGIAWRRFQERILEREGFGSFVKRNATLQKTMIETAIQQKIPFSILRLPSERNIEIAIDRSPATRLTNVDAVLAR